jgi:phage terminase large subunit
MAVAIPQSQIDAYVTAAHGAGCPQDQIERFIVAGYVALPKILAFHSTARAADDGIIRELMLDGTRGSAKSHGIIAQVCLDDCQRHANLKWLFLRQTQQAARESFYDLVSRVLQGIPHTANMDRVMFPNGSRVVIGGYKDEHDIDKYIGVEYDGLAGEDINQISGSRYERLLGSVRTSRDNWTPRVYLSTNPGGIGHTYYKERFVIPQREHRETTTRRLFTSYKDNPFIDQGYREYLDHLTGDLAKMWRDGDWDIFAGQVFSMWREDRHVIKPFTIPDHWVKWRAIDWGYAAPFCCLWFAKDTDTRRLYIYRELYLTGITDDRQAEMIRDMTVEQVQYSYADPSMWTKRTTDINATSTADEYARHGVILTRADNDRLSGKRKVDRYLSNAPDGLPGLQVFETCANLIRTLPSLPYDNIRVEDVDTDAEDHAYDALRYGLTNQITESRPKQYRQHPLSQLKGI